MLDPHLDSGLFGNRAAASSSADPSHVLLPPSAPPVHIDLGPSRATAPQRRRDRWREWITRCPPWLVSTLLHTGILLLAAGMVSTFADHSSNELELIFAEQLGEQLVEEGGDPTVHGDQIPVEAPLPPVQDPAATPLTPTQPTPTSDVSTPSMVEGSSSSETAEFVTAELKLPQVSHALAGREIGSRSKSLGQYGGNATTEDAVKLALKWLAKHQRRAGNWSLVGPYADAGTDENEIAATALTMLAFQGAGHTHRTGDYQQKLNRAKSWLVASQTSDGAFWKGRGMMSHQLYTHAIATMAICELYGMTHDDKLKKVAQKALDYSASIQDEAGGWRYEPGLGSDTSVTGWFVMALQSGRMAGLHVPSETLLRVHHFLDQVAEDEGARYAYLPNHASTPTMTAEGLLCRQYLGWDRRDSRMARGVDYLLDNPIETSGDERNAYYWYYATQVTHHLGGEVWDTWNGQMRQRIPEMQVRRGKEQGSWDPDGHPYGNHAGRLYITCLCTYMLEVYYRHLPLYEGVYEE